MAINLKIKGDASEAIAALKKVGANFSVVDTKTKSLTSQVAKGTLAFVGIAGAAQVARKGLSALSDVVKGSTTGVGELGNTIAKQARMVGITAEQYQGLRFAAERSGVSITAIANGLKKLGRTMVDAQNGSRQTKETFGALDVQLTKQDGTLRNSFDAFTDLSDRFAAMGPSAERTGASMILLGRSGTEMANLMAEGGQGLQDMISMAEDLGAIMSKELLASSEAYKDSVVDLDFALQGAKNQMAEQLLPTITAIAVALREFVTSIDWRSWAAGVRDALLVPIGMFTKLAEVSSIVAGGLRAWFKPQIEAVSGWVKTAEDFYDVSGLLKTAKDFYTGAAEESLGLTEATKKGKKEQDSYGQALRKALSSLEAMRQKTNGAKKAQSQFNKEVDAWNKAQVKAFEESKKAVAAFYMETATEEERLAAKLADTLGMLSEARRRTAVEQSEYDELRAKAFAVHNDAINALRQEDLDKEREAQEERTRLFENYRSNQLQAAVDVMGAASEISGAISDVIAAQYGEQSLEAREAAQKVFAIQQALALGQAVVLGAVAIQQAAASAPPPANIPAIIGQSAITAANIATILATTIAGVADAGLPPGALKAAGLNNHTVLAVRNDEMVLDPVGTRAISQMLQQRASGGVSGDPVVVNTTLEIDGHVLGQTVDNHLIRSQERGIGYQRRVGYGMGG